MTTSDEHEFLKYLAFGFGPNDKIRLLIWSSPMLLNAPKPTENEDKPAGIHKGGSNLEPQSGSKYATNEFPKLLNNFHFPQFRYKDEMISSSSSKLHIFCTAV